MRFAIIAFGWIFTSIAATGQVHVLDFQSTPPAGVLLLEQLPKTPAKCVVDEGNALSEAVRSQTEAALSDSINAQVFLLIQNGELPTSLDAYSNEVLRRWISGRSKLGALVLATTDPISTRIILAGRKLDEMDVEQLTDLGTAALKLADTSHDAALNSAEGAARAAIALVPALNTFAEIYQNPVADAPVIEAPAAAAAAAAAVADSANRASKGANPTEPGSARMKTNSRWDLLAARLDWPKIRFYSLVTGLVILALAALIFIPRMFRNRRMYFPEHQPRRRFDGPHAGGSNGSIRYGRQ